MENKQQQQPKKKPLPFKVAGLWSMDIRDLGVYLIFAMVHFL